MFWEQYCWLRIVIFKHAQNGRILKGSHFDIDFERIKIIYNFINTFHRYFIFCLVYCILLFQEYYYFLRRRIKHSIIALRYFFYLKFTASISLRPSFLSTIFIVFYFFHIYYSIFIIPNKRYSTYKRLKYILSSCFYARFDTL